MYLSYSEYQNMGGKLDYSAYTRFSKKAEYLINSQSAGLTGKRISKQGEIPQAIKDCVFELMDLLNNFSDNEKNISSESQSSGGVSESYTYITKTTAELEESIENIIFEHFYGGGIGVLLTRGYINGD